MSYMTDIEQALHERVQDLAEEQHDEVIRFVKERLLESYRNGIEAGQRGHGRQRDDRTGGRFARRT